MEVYVIRFKSTGEHWNTCVCASFPAVERVLAAHRMVKVYGEDHDYYQEWQDTLDKSQTATVVKHPVIER